MGQLTFEGSALTEELISQAFTLFDHGISIDAIDEVIAAYANFTDNYPDPELDTMAKMITDPHQLDKLDYSKDKQKEWHKYRTNHPFIFKPGGYTNRSLQAKALKEVTGLEVEDDPKEYFHFLPSGLALMNKQASELGWGPLPPEVNHLNLRFITIHRLGAEAIRNALYSIEETHPETISRFVTKKDLDNSPVRLIFYHPGQGDVLAGGHYDKSWISAQLAESHEGLRIRNPKTGEMQDIRRPPDKAAIFAGSLLNLRHAYSDSLVKAGWHDVINTSKFNEGRSLHGKNVARWALIFFANSEAAGEIGKEITHNEQPLADSSELVA